MIANTHYGYVGKSKAPKFTYTGNYKVRDDGVVELLTSGTIVFLEQKVIDLFMVGGGGGGMGYTGSNTQAETARAGGGGGYTRTVRRVNVAAQTRLTVIIGEGGLADNAGGSTGFGDKYTVSGGAVNTRYPVAGGAGGSGGGGAVFSNSDYGAGGYDGNNGERGYGQSNAGGGSGQGFTTREFGEASGKLYAGGGGGGRYIAGATFVISPGGSGGGGSGACGNTTDAQAAFDGGANTGGGGGGAATSAGTSYTLGRAGSGGSGIVCFRESVELPELAGTWLLNERLYAPESAFNENVNFTFYTEKGSAISGKQIRVSSSQLYVTQTSGNDYQVYNFSSNTWQQKYKKWKFEVDTTVSDEFRAWLTSNATKQ